MNLSPSILDFIFCLASFISAGAYAFYLFSQRRSSLIVTRLFILVVFIAGNMLFRALGALDYEWAYLPRVVFGLGVSLYAVLIAEAITGRHLHKILKFLTLGLTVFGVYAVTFGRESPYLVGVVAGGYFVAAALALILDYRHAHARGHVGLFFGIILSSLATAFFVVHDYFLADFHSLDLSLVGLAGLIFINIISQSLLYNARRIGKQLLSRVLWSAVMGTGIWLTFIERSFEDWVVCSFLCFGLLVLARNLDVLSFLRAAERDGDYLDWLEKLPYHDENQLELALTHCPIVEYLVVFTRKNINSKDLEIINETVSKMDTVVSVNDLYDESGKDSFATGLLREIFSQHRINHFMIVQNKPFIALGFRYPGISPPKVGHNKMKVLRSLLRARHGESL